MPAILTNANQFLFTTDFPLDKIIYMTSGSVDIPATDFRDISIPHGLTYTPLMDGTYSTDSSFSVSYDIGSGQPYPGSFGLFGQVTSVEADATNVYFHAINYTSGAVTVYYRLFGLMPSNVNLDSPATSALADLFQLNPTYNYAKLLQADRLTSTTTINHGLGYRPEVSLWHEVGGRIYKTIHAQPGTSLTNVRARVTTSDVIVSVFSADAAHTRIYLDE